MPLKCLSKRRAARTTRRDAALSDVFGTVLLLGVTVSLTAAAAVHLQPAPPRSQDGEPSLSVLTSVEVGRRDVTLLHAGGRALDLADLRAVVVVNDDVWFDDVAGPKGMAWTHGDALTIGPLKAPVPENARVEVGLVGVNAGSMMSTMSFDIPTLGAAVEASLPSGVLGFGTGFGFTNATGGTGVFVDVAVTHPEGRKSVKQVTARMPTLDVPPLSLGDDGRLGDPYPGDGRYSGHLFIPILSPPGMHPVLVTILDIHGNVVTLTGGVDVGVIPGVSPPPLDDPLGTPPPPPPPLIGPVGCVAEAPKILGEPVVIRVGVNNDPYDPTEDPNIERAKAKVTVDPLGANRILVVWVADDDHLINEPVNAVTYGGVPLARLTRYENLELGTKARSDQGIEMWYLVDPPGGTHDLVVKWPGTVDAWVVAAITYSGVDPLKPLGTYGGRLGDSTDVRHDLTTLGANSLVAGAFVHDHYGAILAPATGITERFDVGGGDDIQAGGGDLVAPVPGTYSLRFAASKVPSNPAHRDWAILVTEIRGVGGGSVPCLPGGP